MLREKSELKVLEAHKEVDLPCDVVAGGAEDVPTDEALAKIATDAYIVGSCGRVPRRGMIKEVLAGATEWKLDGFRIVPSESCGELHLLFNKPGSADKFVIELWRAGTEPGFILRIILPTAQDPLQRSRIVGESFAFQTEEHSGGKRLTVYCSSERGVKYYPHFVKGDTFDERYVIKESLRLLESNREYNLK